MRFTLDKVVPWGRSYEEYVNMFGLTETDLGLRILGCGDGPAAFNSVLTQRGGNVVSVDPVYIFEAEQIRIRIADTYETVMSQMYKNHSDYVWGVIPSVEQLGRLRMSAMEVFLADFDAGKQAGRYMTKSTSTYWNALNSENQEHWTPIKGLEGMAEELTLSIDQITGEYTRLTRFLPGADTSEFGGIRTWKEYLLSVVIFTTRHLICGWNQGITPAVRPVNFTVHSKRILAVLF